MLNLTPLPPEGTPISDELAKRISLEAQQAQVTLQDAEAQRTMAYRVSYLDAANRAADGAGEAAVEGETEAELAYAFMKAMCADWAAVSRGPNDMAAKAKGMAQAFRALYPTP